MDPILDGTVHLNRIILERVYVGGHLSNGDRMDLGLKAHVEGITFHKEI
jgi:hypothetical protein